MWSPSFRVLLVGLLVAKLLHTRDCTPPISCTVILDHYGQRNGLPTPCHRYEPIKQSDIDEVSKITYGVLEIKRRKSSAQHSEVPDGERIKLMNTVSIIPDDCGRGENAKNMATSRSRKTTLPEYHPSGA
ncbi:hypothetical protein KP509_05G077400 [Ceratopteris richardii]|uniref:Uncharacterized protein n=1 Tax=Ceratopteris richardii TaxID=49495 RepID=A0A8T2UQ83_CERRI|nr:hypothetical protein KP509_05G077400 [Ceratopteris richardii]